MPDDVEGAIGVPPDEERSETSNIEKIREILIGDKVSSNFLKVINEVIDTGKTGELNGPALNLFRSKPQASQLCALPTKAESGEGPKRTADPRTWEVLSAVVDSGATIAALNPKTGTGYPIEETAESRAGVEYDTASEGNPVQNLGRKRMAVLTPEGTLRGYTSEVADVSSDLQSVRQLLGAKHCVLFGLGPEGEDHLIVNKISGEVNRMRDDDTNYLQDLLIVPPEHLESVILQLGGQGTDPAAPFGRLG